MSRMTVVWQILVRDVFLNIVKDLRRGELDFSCQSRARAMFKTTFLRNCYRMSGFTKANILFSNTRLERMRPFAKVPGLHKVLIYSDIRGDSMK